MIPIRLDFRSDTVTRPTPAMRQAMAEAEVGDDVYGDDPTVRRLEETAAGMLAKPAALFFPSGTQSNLAALMTHCGRGDEYLVGQHAHCYRWEAGGAAVLGSIQPQPIAHQPDGTLALEDIRAEIKADDLHCARTRLLALENTFGGRALSLDYMKAASDLAHGQGLACHLDGARLFNAATRLGIDAARLAAPFDTVSFCLSKGLGAPVGSMLVGEGAAIATARRMRKLLGGALRQSGILAAAGLYALEHHVERLAEDHRLAERLAQGLSQHAALSVASPDTNILFVDVAEDHRGPFAAWLQTAGVGINADYGGGRQRWVTHLDLGPRDVDVTLDIVAAYFAGR
jgi:threonine aldolase